MQLSDCKRIWFEPLLAHFEQLRQMLGDDHCLTSTSQFPRPLANDLTLQCAVLQIVG